MCFYSLNYCFTLAMELILNGTKWKIKQHIFLDIRILNKVLQVDGLKLSFAYGNLGDQKDLTSCHWYLWMKPLCVPSLISHMGIQKTLVVVDWWWFSWYAHRETTHETDGLFKGESKSTTRGRGHTSSPLPVCSQEGKKHLWPEASSPPLWWCQPRAAHQLQTRLT